MAAVPNMLRRLLPPVGTPPAPAGLPPALRHGPYEQLDSDVGTLWLSSADHVIRDHLRSAGCWEPDEGRLLRRLLFPGARFLDVGANVGYFSLLAARAHPGITIDAVEPYPTTVEMLRFNLWANGVGAKVWPVALDVTRRSLSIAAAANNVGDARVAEVSTTGDAGQGALVDIVVPAVPGDELFAGRGFDVVKLDVQGWELEVLTGMAGTLAASPGCKIVAEYWPSALRQRGLDPVGRLERYRDGLGLRVLVCDGDELEELEDREIVARCDSAGPDGQVNLLLQP